ncbi:MAG TPA: hypothetical protein VF817_03715 [Patescibacteria group bacterium]
MEEKDIEEQAGDTMKLILDQIWLHFLQSRQGSDETWYELVDPEKNPVAGSHNEQEGLLDKIEHWNPPIIQGRKYNSEKNRTEFTIVHPHFEKFYKTFANPREAYARYRIGMVIPIQLPDGTTWEHITVKFLNGNDVKITLLNHPEFSHQTSYNEMGFRNNKNQAPNKQWELLLALAQNSGSIFWSSTSNLPQKMINNLKSQKMLLSKKLEAYFQLKDDPFFDYNTQDGYKIKMTLVPEKAESKAPKSKDDDLGIVEAYNEQATQAWEDEPREEQW